MPDPQPQGIPLPGVRWRGFTLQMFLFIIVPLTLLLIIIVIASQSLHHDSMRQLVGDRDLRAVRAAANSLSREVQSRGAALQMAAQEVNGAADPAARVTALASGSGGLTGFDGGLALVDASGKITAGHLPAIPDLPARLPPAAATVTYSPPLIGTDETWYVLAITPIQNPARARLVGAFTPAALAQSALTGVSAANSTVMLLSPQGSLLYLSGVYDHNYPINRHPGVPEVLRGESGVNYTTGGPDSAPGAQPMVMLPGQTSDEHVVAFSPVPPLGWGLLLEEPWEQNAPSLLNATQTAPLILAPVLLLALFALWFGARQIIQPLQTLETRAADLAGGDFSAIQRPVGGISEIRNLQDELVTMAAALQSAQDALHAYIGSLTAGVETERRALARELHDDTLQALIALNQQAQMAMLRAPDPAQKQALLALQGRVTETIASLRRAIGGLRPIYLEDLGLPAALGMLAKQADERPAADGSPPGPVVSFNLSGNEQRLPPETELAFYRIAQEALNNAIHHARAAQVQIILSFNPASVELCISDNGAGFTPSADPGAFAHRGHYGLLGMRERADLAGAEMAIESEVGKGTTVRVKKALEGE